MNAGSVMRWIQNLDLKNKLVLLATVSGTMALIMACAGFVWHDQRLLRSAQIEKLRSKAEMLALSSTLILTNDRPDFAKILATTLKSNSSIVTAGVFDKAGNPIACFPSMQSDNSVFTLPANCNSYRYTESGELELFYPIFERGREVCVVYLKANMREFYEQARDHAAMIITLTLCSLGVAVLFASMMQSLISRPILQLSAAARTISTNDDYTIRVETDSRDELGELYESFNRMVEKIQTSQSELKQARDEMEDRVEQRTQQLQTEIIQRESIQQELVNAKEAAEAASESKSRFLANMSHEIRTPLNGILGFTDYVLVHDRSLTEQDRGNYLKTIKRSGECLLMLINDILDLSKIESGQMDFECVDFSPHGVIADVISFLRPKAREKNLHLEYRWDGGVPATIKSDSLRFRQLLVNLVGNAIKFTEKGSVNVVARVNQTSRKLTVEVTDTGIGIPIETQPRLFNPFTQGDSSVTRRFGGTGLGLSICKNIVDGLGGKISLTSELGRGSTFRFEIDTGALESVSMSSIPLEDIVFEEPTVRRVGTLRSKRILVADDGETNRKLIQLLLSQSGAEVEMVENGLEAVVAARNSQFDLILLDMQMPVMDGYFAAQHLREEGFKNPIVALTAHAMRGDEERCIQMGCSEYLTKPIRRDLLLRRVAELVGVTESDEFEVAEACPSNEGGAFVSELPIEIPQFAELVCEFIDRAHDKVTEMNRAFQSNDHEQLRKLAHWMKGSGGMAGFPILTESARELEFSTQSNDWKAIEQKLAVLESFVNQLQSPVAC